MELEYPTYKFTDTKGIIQLLVPFNNSYYNLPLSYLKNNKINTIKYVYPAKDIHFLDKIWLNELKDFDEYENCFYSLNNKLTVNQLFKRIPGDCYEYNKEELVTDLHIYDIAIMFTKPLKKLYVPNFHKCKFLNLCAVNNINDFDIGDNTIDVMENSIAKEFKKPYNVNVLHQCENVNNTVINLNNYIFNKNSYIYLENQLIYADYKLIGDVYLKNCLIEDKLHIKGNDIHIEFYNRNKPYLYNNIKDIKCKSLHLKGHISIQNLINPDNIEFEDFSDIYIDLLDFTEAPRVFKIYKPNEYATVSLKIGKINNRTGRNFQIYLYPKMNISIENINLRLDKNENYGNFLIIDKNNNISIDEINGDN